MRFLKKHFTKFIMAFTLAFTCLFVAFGCTTFASPGYTISSDGLSLDTLNLYNWQTDFLGVRANSGCTITNNDDGSFTISNISGIRPYVYFQLNDTNYNSNMPYTISYSSNNSSIIQFTELNGARNLYEQWVSGTKSSSGYWDFGIEFLSNLSNATITITNFMFNEGTEALDYFPYWNGVNANTYNQLEDNYTNLQDQYINLKNRYNYGFFADLTSLNIIGYNNGLQVFDDSFNLHDLINTNYFSNGVFLLDNFILSYNSNTYDSASIKFNFSPNLIPSNVDLIFVGSYAFNFNFVIGFSDNSTYGFTITNNDNIISHIDLNNYSVAFGNVSITNFKFNYNKNDYIPNINYNSDYSYAYNTGFSEGQNSSFSTIQQLENNINDLNTQVANMTSTINTLQVAYNDLNTSYENMLNGNNFANLFFTIAETPFASFKQIWNVDFLGVNLAGFVTGILFLGLIIWVIKRIF